jgi:neurotransmitter:Na+ symporter, NSS family
MSQHSNNQQWSSRIIFILAAIGAAAGLGNLWRFPYQVYANGGGAFLFAYIILLLAIVVPLVIMEVGFGQKHQLEVVDSFGQKEHHPKNWLNSIICWVKKEKQESIVEALDVKHNWFGKFTGWLPILLLFVLIGYYSCIIAWSFDFLWFSPSVAWSTGAEEFFYTKILNISDNISIWGGLSKPVVIGLLATYATIYFSIFQGVKSVTRVIKWTATLPFILLAILLINSLFLPGAKEGFEFFLKPDWIRLADPSLWKAAGAQALFSANVGVALTIFYASCNKKNQDITGSSTWIAIGNFSVSLLAGFAIFGTLGWLAQTKGVPISEVVESGVTLSFVTFPAALAQLPFGAPVFSILFFLTLISLGIDSVFALAEAIIASFKHQFRIFKNMKRELLVGILCIIFFLWSLTFAGGNGLYRLDITDHFLFEHLLYPVVISQLILIGWMMPAEKLRLYINSVSKVQLGKWWTWIPKVIAPAILIWFYISALPTELAKPYGDYPTNQLWIWGGLPIIATIVIAALLACKKEKK